MKKRSQMTRLLMILFPALFLAACGSGAGSEGAGDCDAASAAPGETVVCTVTGFEEDCTVFVGTTPVDAAYREEEGEIEFAVPPMIPPGPRDISFQCGADEPVIVSNNFSILPPEEPVKGECEDNTGCLGGLVCREGGCVVPAEPAATTIPPLFVPTGIPEKVYPNLPPGIGSLPIGGLAVDPMKVSLEVEALHETRLGLIQIDWKIEGGGKIQKVYLYGSFNRFSSEDGCSLEGKRYLAVNSSGGEIVYEERDQGESTYEKYREYVEGEKCREEENCPRFGEHFDQKYLSSHGLPICRIDLAGVGDKASFFTRMIEDGLKFVLAVQAEDGTWKTVEKTFEAPKLEIEDVKVGMEKDRPAFNVQFTYRNALYLNVSGCEGGEGLPRTDQDRTVGSSSGTVNLRNCPLVKRSTTLIVTADGLDPQDFKTEKFQVTLETPSAVLTAGSVTCSPSTNLYPNAATQDHCKGTVDLHWSVSRRFTITDLTTDKIVGVGEVPWVRSVELLAQWWQTTTPEWPSQGVQNVTAEGRGTFTGVRRWVDMAAWTLRVVDLDGAKVPSNIVELPYRPVFEVKYASGTCHRESRVVRATNDDCGNVFEGIADGVAGIFGGDVCDSKTVRRSFYTGIDVYYTVQLQHVSKLEILCPGFTDEVATSSYQLGVFSIHKHADAPKRRIECTFKATTYDGKTETKNVSPRHCD